VKHTDDIRGPDIMSRLIPLLLLPAVLTVFALRADEPEPNGQEAVPAVETPPAEAPQPPVPLEYQPYRARVWVEFAHDPSLTAAFQRRVREEIAVRIRQIFGLVIALDAKQPVETARWQKPLDEAGLERLTESEVRRQLGDSNPDKAFVVLVRTRGPRFEIACREWDAARNVLSPVSVQETWERPRVAETAVTLLWRVFQPIYTVDDVDPQADRARVSVRAGRLPLGDPEKALVKPGDLLQPFFRYLDRQQLLQRVQVIDWTYLIVERVDGGEAACQIISGRRGALGTNRRRRVEARAVRVQPMHRETSLRLALYTNREQTLGGHQIVVTPKSADESAPAVEPFLAVTDRDGTVRLQNAPEYDWAWLAVRSGDTLLARVPFVPGLVPEATLELMNDAQRLAVERELDLMKTRLVETVARRATLSSRALALARAGDEPGARRLLADAEQLPKLADFESQLNAVRVPALEAAQASRDRLAEGRINRLCSQTRDLIRHYLAEDKLRVVREEIDELTKPDAKAKAPAKK